MSRNRSWLRRRTGNSARAARGFTLLEVMISLAILAVGMVAIGDLNGGAVQMHAYARRASEASLLLRGKMLDIEELLTKDGFSDYDDEKHGDFDDEHQPDYTWSAEILKPDIKLDGSQLINMMSGSGLGGSGSSSSSSSSSSSEGGGGLGGLLGMLGGGGLAGLLGGGSSVSGAAGSGVSSGSPGGASALASAGPLAGIIQSQATGFIETIKKSVREVRLSVNWKDGNVQQSISASQIIVILPDSVGKAGATQQLTPQQIAAQAQQNQASGTTTKPVSTSTTTSGDGSSQ